MIEHTLLKASDKDWMPAKSSEGEPMHPFFELLRAIPDAWFRPRRPRTSDRQFTYLAAIQLCAAGFVCAQLPRAIGEHEYLAALAGGVFLVVVWRRIIAETSSEET